MLFKAKNLSWDKLTTAYIVIVHAALALSISSSALVEQLLPHGPEASKNISSPYSLLLITIGLFARPLGALIFGIRSDLLGYSKSVRESMPLLLISTALIGILPESTLGIYGLALLRIGQGVGYGGTYTAIASYLYAQSPKKYQGQITGLFQSSVYVGYVLMSLLLLLYKTSFSEYLLTGQGWRFLFFLPLLWLLMFRTLVSVDPSESKASISRAELNTYLQKSFLEIRTNWQRILPSLLLISGLGVLAFAAANFKSYFLKVILQVPPLTTDVSVITTSLIALPFYFFGGYLADKFSFFKVNVPLGLGTCIYLPLCFRYIDMVAGHSPSMGDEPDFLSIAKVCGGLVIFTCLCAFILGGLVKYTCDLFSERHRGLLFGITYTLSFSVIGGWINLYESPPSTPISEQYHSVDLIATIGAVAILASLVAKLIFHRTNKVRNNI